MGLTSGGGLILTEPMRPGPSFSVGFSATSATVLMSGVLSLVVVAKQLPGTPEATFFLIYIFPLKEEGFSLLETPVNIFLHLIGLG